MTALNQQDLPADQYEVILVDDGSKEDVAGLVRSLHVNFPINLLKQNQLGPAAARNRGASEANGRIILFLDNDMIAQPCLLSEHLHSHPCDEIGRLVAGPRSRDGNGRADPLEWLDYLPDGSDPRLEKQPFSFQEMFTCNLSIRRLDWEKLSGFRDEFKTASFEDIEFAYRAMRSGLKLVFNPKALAAHSHPLQLEDRLNRAASYTQTVPLLYQMHPELRGQIAHLLDKEPVHWKTDSFALILRKFLRFLLAWKPIRELNRQVVRSISYQPAGDRMVKFFYWKLVGSYQYIGLQEGIKRYGWIAGN